MAASVWQTRITGSSVLLTSHQQCCRPQLRQM